MMTSAIWVLIGVVFIIVFLVILFFLPTEKKGSQSKKVSVEEDQERSEDWKALSLKLEKHIQSLREQNGRLEKQRRDLDRELTIQKEKYQQAQEKLKLQRGWHEKEDAQFEKNRKDLAEAKESLQQTEQKLNEEHAERLRLERRIKENQDELTSMKESVRGLETEVARLKAQGDAYRREIQELKAENQKLSQQHNDATWVTKSEYLKLEGMYKEKEKEMMKLREQLRREIG